jgi:hypothetical protein
VAIYKVLRYFNGNGFFIDIFVGLEALSAVVVEGLETRVSKLETALLDQQLSASKLKQLHNSLDLYGKSVSGLIASLKDLFSFSSSLSISENQKTKIAGLNKILIVT